MKYLQCLLLVVMSLLVGCGEISYWTYTRNAQSAHIVHPEIIPVWIDARFNPKQVEEIKASIKEWNYVLNGQIVIELQTKWALGIDKKMYPYPAVFNNAEEGQTLLDGAERTHLGWVIFNWPSNIKQLEDANDSLLAFVDGIGEHRVIVIGDRLGTRSLKDILMHEFAHLLGAEHVNTPSLEYPKYDSSQYNCIDKITVAQVAHMHGIAFYKLNYCITPYFE